MRSVTATLFITLDGFTQGVGRVDEDTREGFTDVRSPGEQVGLHRDVSGPVR